MKNGFLIGHVFWRGFSTLVGRFQPYTKVIWPLTETQQYLNRSLMNKEDVHIQLLTKNSEGNSLLTNGYRNSAVKSIIIVGDCQYDEHTIHSSTNF